MARAKIGVRRIGGGDLGHHRLRIAECRRHPVELAQLGRVGPAAAREAGIFQDGEVELDLVRCGVLR